MVRDAILKLEVINFMLACKFGPGGLCCRFWFSFLYSLLELSVVVDVPSCVGVFSCDSCI